MKKLLITAAISSIAAFSSCTKCNEPLPYGAIPTSAQVEWQKMEYYMFVHFGPNTFTDKEWGDGKEDPNIFNPSALDCRQWASTAKEAGMKGIILTAKHHDGFCLWPSKYSTHTVRESKWMDGKGNVVEELWKACKEYGLEFGVYISPWDRNHPDYGTDKYNQIFAGTLEEIHSKYDEIFEQWFDGAGENDPKNGKQIYDWTLFNNTVYKYHPNAVIFSDVGPGCRWMGNEAGKAGETNWSRLNTDGFGPGKNAPARDTLSNGNKYGVNWIPAEVDVSIRPGWFYSPSTNEKVKSVEHLMNIYLNSVGCNGNLLLNVPPDRKGRIHENDSTRLMEFRRAREEFFKENIAPSAKITASNTRSSSKEQFTAQNMIDSNYDSYWATDDNINSATIKFSFAELKKIHAISIQEYIPLGQRIESFNIEYHVNSTNDLADKWIKLADATTIGNKRIISFKTIETTAIRININSSLACPVINNIEIY